MYVCIYIYIFNLTLFPFWSTAVFSFASALYVHILIYWWENFILYTNYSTGEQGVWSVDLRRADWQDDGRAAEIQGHTFLILWPSSRPMPRRRRFDRYQVPRSPGTDGRGICQANGGNDVRREFRTGLHQEAERKEETLNGLTGEAPGGSNQETWRIRATMFLRELTCVSVAFINHSGCNNQCPA